MAEYPLLRIPDPLLTDRTPGRGGGGTLNLPGRRRQGARLGPTFQRLRSSIDASTETLDFTADPAAIAPERALVFEVAGSVDGFQRAVARVPGLEYLGDEEIEFDADEDFSEPDTRRGRAGRIRDDRPLGGRLYLAMPDLTALEQLLSLWRRYQNGEEAPHGFAPWFDVFDRLRAIRPWGPEDRISNSMVDYLEDLLSDDLEGPIRLEVELWSFRSSRRREAANSRFEASVANSGGELVHRSSIAEIAYEGALVDLPVEAVLRIRGRESVHLAICDDVMFVRPQAMASFPTTVEDSTTGEGTIEPPPTAPPIVALIDGVPVEGHQLLADRLDVDDPDDLASTSIVEERRHGTEMASLIIHGDRRLRESSLPRKIYVRPVLRAPGGGAPERPSDDRLLIDTIYRAVLRMKEGDSEGPATAPEVFVVNLSLGDQNRPFTGSMSPWGRLLDYLADRYGILFVVSAGNVLHPLQLPGFRGLTDFEDATPEERETAILEALGTHRSQRTLISPAESLNAVTVGAWHEDSMTRSHSRLAYGPFEDSGPNISSAMGLGHRKIVKPDIFMPGGREHVHVVSSGSGLSLRPIEPGRLSGLLAAVPDSGGRTDREGSTGMTSGAAALATRAAHRIFDALTDEDNGALLENADPMFYGVVVKALLAHRARWSELSEKLETLFGPHGQGKHVARKDNVARMLGYGRPEVDEAMECAPNRATLVGFDEIQSGEAAHLYRVPLPSSLENVKEPRRVTVTLAWFSPVNLWHRAYRRAKLEIEPDHFQDKVGVQRVAAQPSHASSPRGALFHVSYEGAKAVRFLDNGCLLFKVFCREQGGPLDRSIKYGLAVTIEAGMSVPVYSQVRQALQVRQPV